MNDGKASGVTFSGVRFESDRDIPHGAHLEAMLTKDGTVIVYGRVPGKPWAVAICRIDRGLLVVPDAPFFGADDPTFTARDENRHAIAESAPSSLPATTADGDAVAVDYEYTTKR